MPSDNTVIDPARPVSCATELMSATALAPATSRTQSTARPSPASPLTTLAPIIGSTSRMRIRPLHDRVRGRPRERILKQRGAHARASADYGARGASGALPAAE